MRLPIALVSLLAAGACSDQGFDRTLKALEGAHSPAALRAEVSRRVNGTEPRDWWSPRPALASRSRGSPQTTA